MQKFKFKSNTNPDSNKRKYADCNKMKIFVTHNTCIHIACPRVWGIFSHIQTVYYTKRIVYIPLNMLLLYTTNQNKIHRLAECLPIYVEIKLNIVKWFNQWIIKKEWQIFSAEVLDKQFTLLKRLLFNIHFNDCIKNEQYIVRTLMLQLSKQR